MRSYGSIYGRYQTPAPRTRFSSEGWRDSLHRRRTADTARCRLVASWGGSTSQGLGCSPIKAVRELGSERRETVRDELSTLPQRSTKKEACFEGEHGNLRPRTNLAKCWELRGSRATVSRSASGDNAPGADDQQERPRSTKDAESSQAIRRTRASEKIWSDPCGDAGSQREQKPAGLVTRSRSLSSVRAGELRGAAPSTRGPGWADRWCTSCHANGIAR